MSYFQLPEPDEQFEAVSQLPASDLGSADSDSFIFANNISAASYLDPMWNRRSYVESEDNTSIILPTNQSMSTCKLRR